MANGLHYETITPLLKDILQQLMGEPLFFPFRLVGGTNLSLRYGHRYSVDIDLFTDAEYGSLDFKRIESFLQQNFPYYSCNDKTSIVGFGRGYYIGNTSVDSIKLDLMYTEPFLSDVEYMDGVRLAAVEDIIAMKMNVISHGGRKKDFWDIHMLLEQFPLEDMLAFHARRYEWEHDPQEILAKFIDFSVADTEFPPVCLLQKDWDEIKLDLIDIRNCTIDK